MADSRAVDILRRELGLLNDVIVEQEREARLALSPKEKEWHTAAAARARVDARDLLEALGVLEYAASGELGAMQQRLRQLEADARGIAHPELVP